MNNKKLIFNTKTHFLNKRFDVIKNNIDHKKCSGIKFLFFV